jgi:hypothetical protein
MFFDGGRRRTVTYFLTVVDGRCKWSMLPEAPSTSGLASVLAEMERAFAM